MSSAIKVNPNREFNESKLELYSLLSEGLRDIKEGRVRDAEEVFKELEQEDE